MYLTYPVADERRVVSPGDEGCARPASAAPTCQTEGPHAAIEEPDVGLAWV